MFIDAMFSDPDVRDEPMEIGFDQAPVMFKMDRDYEHDFSFVATKGPPSIVVRIGTGLKPDAEFASWVSGFCAVKTFDHRWNHQALLELRALSKVATETYDLEELIANTIDRLEAPMSECNDHHLESSNGQAEGPESSPILAEGDFRIPSELVAINCALEPGEECGPDLVVHRISTRNKRASSDTHHLVSCQVETGDKSTRQGSRGHGSGLWHLGQLTTAKRDLQDHRGPILLFDHALSPAKEAPALKDARTGTISMNHMTVRQYLSAKEEHEMWPDAKALNQQPSFFWYRRQSGTAHASVEDHGILHDSGRSRLLLSPVRILAKSGLMLLCLASMHIMRNYAVSRELSSPAANTWFLSMAIRGDQNTLQESDWLTEPDPLLLLAASTALSISWTFYHQLNERDRLQDWSLSGAFLTSLVLGLLSRRSFLDTMLTVVPWGVCLALIASDVFHAGITERRGPSSGHIPCLGDVEKR